MYIWNMRGPQTSLSIDKMLKITATFDVAMLNAAGDAQYKTRELP